MAGTRTGADSHHIATWATRRRRALGRNFALGSVGAGAGATTATVKGGLGSASAVTPHGHTVAAIVAVNAVGAPTIGAGPHFWAAPFERNGEFGGLGLPASFDTTLRTKGGRGTSTTIGLVATDASADEGAGDASGDHGA